MDIEFIVKEKNELEFEVIGEDIAFFSLVEDVASSKRDVEFVSLKKEDDLKNTFKFYIKTKDDAKKALLECIQEAHEKLDNLLDHLKANLE